MDSYDIHPYALIFPPMSKQDYDELAEDMRANGLLDPITLYGGQILDGRNRYRACANLSIKPRFVEFKGDDESALAFVISKNLARRHLNEAQRAMVAESLANMKAHENQYTKDGCANLHNHKVSQSDAAKKLNVSTRSVATARAIKQNAEPEVVQAVHDGKISLNSAAAIAKLPKKDQKHVMQDDRPDKAVKKIARQKKEQELSQKQAALPSNKYGVIYADPEWSFETYSENGKDRSADNHYPTSSTEDIMARGVKDIAADDCVLFLWATSPMIKDALRVMDAWGFTYKSQAIWNKDKIGTGYWFRNKHEILLVGTRGEIPAPAMGDQFPSVIDAPVGAHSAKPVKFYEIIETYFPTLKKIELNARNRRSGWDSWGNEVESAA